MGAEGPELIGGLFLTERSREDSCAGTRLLDAGKNSPPNRSLPGPPTTAAAAQSQASLLKQPQLPSPQLLCRDSELELTFLVRGAAVTASQDQEVTGISK